MYATRIQRRIRGILGRRRFKRKVAEFEEEERIRNMPPKYYLMLSACLLLNGVI